MSGLTEQPARSTPLATSQPLMTGRCQISPQSERLQRQLHSFVAGDESQPSVEAVCVNARAVGGELNHRTSSFACLVDGPGDHVLAEALTAMVGSDPYRLDLRSFGAVPAQPGDVRELHATDHFPTLVGDDQLVARVGVDVFERPFVHIVDHRDVPVLTKRIVDKQRDDLGQIGTDGRTK